MKYILTEEEYKNLVNKEQLYDLIDKIEILNKKVLELSNSKIYCDREEYYCDKCPISAFGTGTCFKKKRYSK